MAQVTFDVGIGGDGSTVSDDNNPTTGLGRDGHRTRFIPALSNIISIANYLKQKATEATDAAAAAILAPGTSATSATSMSPSSGAKSFTLAQTGKNFAIGQWVIVAKTATPTHYFAGPITAFNAGTGAITVDAQVFNGTGSVTAWTVSLTALGGIPTNRTVTGGGLLTGGGALTSNVVISLASALVADVRAKIDAAKALTIAALFDALAPVALTDGTNIPLDMSTGINFKIDPIGGNRTLLNPTNAKAGVSGTIKVKQDATGGRQLAYGTAYKFPNGPPVLSAGANAVDYITYFVEEGGATPVLACTLQKRFF